MIAANQVGKTWGAAYELHAHLTGLYPPWWKGFRFDRPNKWWASGQTNRKVRDVVQMRLMGSGRKWGTGWIPLDHIIGEPVMSRGLTGLVDKVEIRHVTGGASQLTFMSYEMDPLSWESDSIHGIWFDEEPPENLYDAGQARLTATAGISMMTFTPLFGMSRVVKRFYPRPKTPDRFVIRMGLKDAKHINEKQRERILRRYPSSEHTARTEGIPVLGEGMVYDTEENVFSAKPFEIPHYWAGIIGLDLGGGNHPTAFVLLRWDRDTDTIYIVDAYRSVDPKISTHASAIKHRGGWKVAWPRDAQIQSRGDGRSYAQMYRDEGVKMLPIEAQFSDGGRNIWPGVSMIQDRLSTGRFKVFEHLEEWWEEYRGYHRKEGKIVDEADDLLDATRYAVMMLRYAKPLSQRQEFPDTVGMDYDPLQGVAGG